MTDEETPLAETDALVRDDQETSLAERNGRAELTALMESDGRVDGAIGE